MGLFSRPETEQYKRWQDILSNLAKTETYGGKLTTEPTSYTKYGLDKILQPFLESPLTGDIFAAGKSELAKTLGGGYYSPLTNIFETMYKPAALANLEDTLDVIRRNKAAGEDFFTSERLASETKAGRDVANTLNAILGDIFREERGRQYGALGQVLPFEQYETITAPTSRVEAATTFGDLPRKIEAEGLENQYQAWRQGQAFKLEGANLALQGLTQIPQYGQSPIEKFGAPIAQIIGTIIGAAMGNPAAGMGGITGGTQPTQLTSLGGYKLRPGQTTDFSKYLMS